MFPIFDPSIWLLFFKIFYYTCLFQCIGWALYPDIIFKHSKIANWICHQSLGITVSLLIGFNLVNFDIPTRWLLISPPLLVITRLLLLQKRPINHPKSLCYFKQCKNTFLIYLGTSLLICFIYLYPFIKTKNSGLYAYGGGDHSTYFRVSDLVNHHSLKNLVVSWGLEWPTTESYVSMSVPFSGYPPFPNWSINNFLFYIKYARQSMTFANQTIAVPFFALGFGNEEESYTAGVTIYLLLLCWSAAIFIATLTKKTANALWLGIASLSIGLGAPALSLVLKQTIPAVYAWGAMLLFFSAFVIKNRENSLDLRAGLPFGIVFSTAYLMYLPSIIVSSPVWIYEFLIKIKKKWKSKLLWLLLILGVFVAATNREVDRPLKLFFSNALGALLDYRIDFRTSLFALAGILDFESGLNGKVSWPLLIGALIPILVGLLFYYKIKNKPNTHICIFLIPIFAAILYYYKKGGDYHVIRLIEFSGCVILPIACFGIYSFWRKESKTAKILLSVTVVIFLLNSFYLKNKYITQVLNKIPNARAGIINKNEIQLAKYFQNSSKKNQVIYWMGWGAVPFANHEILFRKLPYVEAFEYDYSYVKLDLLNKKLIEKAVLVFPSEINDILSVNKNKIQNTKKQIFGCTVQKIGQSSGAAIIGTGWLPPTQENGQTVRYLRSNHEGGLVIWSQNKQQIELIIKASGVENDLQLSIEHSDLLLPMIGKIYKQFNESNAEYFARIKKTSSQDKSTQDLIYAVSVDIEKGKNPPSTREEFNNFLRGSVIFHSLIKQNLEKKSSLTSFLEKDFKKCQKTEKLNSFHSNQPTEIKIYLQLQPGIRILRFFVRNKSDQRSGRHHAAGIFYNPEINIPWVVVHSITIL